MKTAGPALIAVVLMFGAGCVTQPDWIESTLVTVEVTRVWEGRVTGEGGARSSPVERALLDVKQEGPKVTGTFQLGIHVTGRRNSGPVEGRVGGDVFHFRVRGSQNEILTGEVTISGDEMEGTLTIHTLNGLQTARISLHRAASPPRPQADRP